MLVLGLKGAGWGWGGPGVEGGPSLRGPGQAVASLSVGLSWAARGEDDRDRHGMEEVFSESFHKNAISVSQDEN